MPVRSAGEPQRHRLTRRVLCVRGTMPFQAQVSPRFGYGMDPHTPTEVAAGVVFTASSLTVGLTATVPFKHDDRDVTAEFKLAEGQSAVFAMDEAGGDTVPRACSGEKRRNCWPPPSRSGGTGSRRRATGAGGRRWYTAQR
jgi:hypothetical protein